MIARSEHSAQHPVSTRQVLGTFIPPASLPHRSFPDALLVWGLVPQKRLSLFPLGIASHAFPPAWAALALM